MTELQLQPCPGGSWLHRGNKTDNVGRRLPIAEIAAAALGGRRDELKAAKESAGATWRSARLVFTTSLGTPVEPRNFNRSWDQRIAKSGVRKITVHDARNMAPSY